MPARDHGTIKFFEEEEEFRRTEDHIFDWGFAQSVQTGKVVLDDYVFQSSTADLKQEKSLPGEQSSFNDLELFDYPGYYEEDVVGTSYQEAGQHFTDVRMEEHRARYSIARAACNVRTLLTGCSFKLKAGKGDEILGRKDQAKEYLVIRARHDLKIEVEDPGAGGAATGGAAEGETTDSLKTEFEAIEAGTQFRPLRVTPKPHMRGPQTAEVCGQSGEEIYTDEYGRVKVQFHWDRYGEKDDKTTCWIRVAQIWAGKNWGAMFIPRIGQEVIVDFLEGDPDQPIITGRVYNDQQTVPYELDGEKTKSTIKSDSSQGSGGYNELRFEDLKGEEEVYFQAEKDLNSVIKNNETRKIGFEKTDAGDLTVDIYNDRTNTLDQGNDKVQVKQGDRDVLVDTGKIFEEAAVKIELKCGQSTITIEPAKITLDSPEIVLSGGMSISISAPDTTVNGSASLTLTGGIVKIN